MGIEQRFDVPLIAGMALREKQIQQSYRPIIGVHRIRLGLSHVKVVVERGARTEAKAYAGMSVLPDG